MKHDGSDGVMRMARGDWAAGRKPVGLVVGGLGTVATAVALVPLRTRIDNTNLALILVVVVVLAAIVGDRTTGAVAAIVATMSFDFFLTQPYLSMRIESADDIETALILLAVGLIVGEVAERGRRSRRESERAAQAIARVHRVSEQIAHGATLDDVVGAVRRELTGLLQLRDCWLELPPFQWPMPRVERGGTLEAAEHHWSRRGFALPEFGVQLPVLEAGHEVGRLVLMSDPAVTVTLEERVIAVALADQLGSAAGMAGPGALRDVSDEVSGRG
jgi:uncharacterized protein DUF4118